MKGTGSAPRLLGFLACVWVLFAGAVAARSDPLREFPKTEITLEIDAHTGGVVIGVWMHAPSGDISLPDAHWLDGRSLELVGLDAAALSDGVIDPDEHDGHAFKISFRGQLAETEYGTGLAAFRDEGGYVLGGDWLPIDEKSVRAHTVTVLINGGQRAVITGSFLGEAADGDKYSARFLHIGPTADLAVFFGQYAVSEARYGTIILRTYFSEPDAALSEQYFAAIRGFLGRYEAEIGPYPYDSFSVVSTKMPVGLGFAGLTYVSERILGHPYMLGRSLAHEILHSWWGNAVGVDLESGNWAEGLTTFMADYALAEDAGETEARDMRQSWLRDLSHLKPDEMRPLAAFRFASHGDDQSEGYGKTALVFSMLRKELGDAAFFTGIRSFFEKHIYGSANWQDLQSAFEVAADRDLVWFFEQWIDRAGLPALVGLSVDESTATAEGYVLITLRQNLPEYRLRVPLEIQTESGSIQYAVDLTEAEQTFRILTPSTLLSIAADPHFQLARRPLEGELPPILRSVRGMKGLRGYSVSQPVDGFMAAGQAALNGIGGPGAIEWQASDAPISAPALVVGTPDDIVRMRNRMFPDEGWVATQESTSRIWVEIDQNGGFWVFVAAKTPRVVREDIASIRYLSNQSFVAFSSGEVVEAGIWSVPGHALRVQVGP